MVMPLSPNFTVNVGGTVAPSSGSMMNTLAFGGDGETAIEAIGASAAIATAANTIEVMNARMVFTLSPAFN